MKPVTNPEEQFSDIEQYGTNAKTLEDVNDRERTVRLERIRSGIRGLLRRVREEKRTRGSLATG